jgi:SAM-dependent methyltransferase
LLRGPWRGGARLPKALASAGAVCDSADVDAYSDRNQEWWDERAAAHAAGRHYNLAEFETGPAYLSPDVALDRPLLADLAGAVGIHLQCHIGADTVSLARLGATMTGLDYSSAAIEQARALAERTGTPARFVHSDVYAALDVVPPHSFDLVYSSLGSLAYLPSIARWAEVVAGLLRPGGRLHVRETHPVVWALGQGRDEDGNELVLHGAYFETDVPVHFDRPDTYASTDQGFAAVDSFEWNHGLGEIVTALLAAGLRLTHLVEYDTAPVRSFPGMERVGEHEFRLVEAPERLPLTYTLQAVAPP